MYNPIKLYNKRILPKVIDWACAQNPNLEQREKIVPLASGNVLEIGIGTGLNLPYFDKKNVSNLIAIDPSSEMWNRNSFDTDRLPFNFNFIRAISEDIPADNNSFDSILFTYTLCSISGYNKAMEEMRRVLKDNGKLFFCEHGIAPDKSVKKWQNLINPIWKTFGGGCNLNRDIPSIIRNNGFKINKIEATYIPGWKPASYNFWGSAVKK